MTDDDADDGTGPRETGGSREVVVPMRLYKTVTVFSTLIAVGCVVAGFVVLDRATQRASVDIARVDPVLAVFGVALIAGGGVVYAYAGRFRAEGMGRGKDNNEGD
ncbi:MAG: hypothetical protein ABEJ70_05155 [Halobacteriaceae archaeon]